MILGDLLHFLFVYGVLLFGFSAGKTCMHSKCKEKMQNTDSDAFYDKMFSWIFYFSIAIVALIDDSSLANETLSNGTVLERSFGAEPFECKKPSYNDIRFTTLEMFKFTIGMGNLEFTDHVQYEEVFYVLLILYIVLTYILMLNMLIALMGHTVERISKDSENIWNLQVSKSSPPALLWQWS